MDQDPIPLKDDVVRKTTAGIAGIFRKHGGELAGVLDLARKIQDRIQAVGPFIERYSSIVCPQCNAVCCTNLHASYNCEDLIYILAIGLRPEETEIVKDEKAPCRFLSQNGCSLDRITRPSGCNWYFCDPLYSRMETGDGFREFDNSLSELAELWMEMVGEFRRVYQRITGNELPLSCLSACSNIKAVRAETGWNKAIE